MAGQSDVLDEDGEANPIISWSDLHVLYQLPDGSKWAEHGNFYDCEDLVSSVVFVDKHVSGTKQKHQKLWLCQMPQCSTMS